MLDQNLTHVEAESTPHMIATQMESANHVPARGPSVPIHAIPVGAKVERYRVGMPTLSPIIACCNDNPRSFVRKAAVLHACNIEGRRGGKTDFHNVNMSNDIMDNCKKKSRDKRRDLRTSAKDVFIRVGGQCLKSGARVPTDPLAPQNSI